MRAPSHAWNSQRSLCIFAGAASVAILCSAFSALYWNRFLAPSAGSTFFYVAEQILQGRLPYRDFLFQVPPLQAWKTAALLQLFGDRLIVPRFEGMLERTAAGVLVYFWLTRFCRPASALLAAFFTIVEFAADPADSVESYHHASVLWAIAAGMSAAYCLDPASRKREDAAAIASGFFCGLSLLTKQTTGMGVLLAIGAVLALLKGRTGGLREAFRSIFLLSTGLLLPLIALVGWLWRADALAPFANTIFAASTSKGSPLTVLTRPFLQFPWLFFPIAGLTPLLARYVLRVPRGDQKESLRTIGIVTAGGALALMLTMIVVFTGVWRPGTIGSDSLPVETVLAVLAEWVMLTLALTGSAFIFIHHGMRFFQSGLTEPEAQIWLMSAASLGVAYMLSLSWAVYGPMAAPGLALIIGLTLDRLEGVGGKPFWSMAGLLCVLIASSGACKLTAPFSWMSWPEPPITEARHASSLPQLAGLRLSAPTLHLTETIAKLVRDNTQPGNSLIVYPYFPLFYSLTGLNPPTYPFNFYIDVCPDDLCRQAAAALLSHPPDAIIYMVEDDRKLSIDESVFRAGSKSGSREIVRAIEKLRPAYRKLLSASVPGGSRTIEVYARPGLQRESTKATPPETVAKGKGS